MICDRLLNDFNRPESVAKGFLEGLKCVIAHATRVQKTLLTRIFWDAFSLIQTFKNDSRGESDNPNLWA